MAILLEGATALTVDLARLAKARSGFKTPTLVVSFELSKCVFVTKKSLQGGRRVRDKIIGRIFILLSGGVECRRRGGAGVEVCIRFFGIRW